LKAEREASRPLEIVVCYEVGYDGFWLARLLIAKDIRTIVFDPASFRREMSPNTTGENYLSAKPSGRPTFCLALLDEISCLLKGRMTGSVFPRRRVGPPRARCWLGAS
jgi:hypothetical protein